ncbi:pregnancy-specific beta-1-glycoprotein 7 [Paroedura picta]|uniref:pregnancy-specific beta-1-glycoprotein 7 n=1 Tax=Paroedura picta TaxID=143630 RepID=UPI004056A8DC
MGERLTAEGERGGEVEECHSAVPSPQRRLSGGEGSKCRYGCGWGRRTVPAGFGVWPLAPPPAAPAPSERHGFAGVEAMRGGPAGGRPAAAGERASERPGLAWGSLGLAAAIMSSCILLAHAHGLRIAIKPPKPTIGNNVTLIPGGSPEFVVCIWYRKDQEELNRIFTYVPSGPVQHPGKGYSGRETGGRGCSLHIRDVALNDSGKYIVSMVMNPNDTEKGHAEIQIVADHVDKKIISDITVWALAGVVLVGILI